VPAAHATEAFSHLAIYKYGCGGKTLQGVPNSYVLHDQEGEEIETCTILTTSANKLMEPIHGRMPVILDWSGENVWLDPRAATEDLQSLMVPFPAGRMDAYAVSAWMSNAKNEGPRCIERMVA
jgi:putative SOS response-associated peptidase YedK